MSALVAIPTYERETLVRHCLSTAAELVLPPGSEVVVIDDASPAMDVEGLMREAGLPVLCHRAPAQLGPSRNSCAIWRHFLDGRHRHLLILDSGEEEWEALAEVRSEDRVIDVWWVENRTGRLMLVLAYLLTRNDSWRSATIRLIVSASAADASRPGHPAPPRERGGDLPC